MKEPRRILDYSSPAEEQRREHSTADERRDGIERYNESTFGERRPIASAFVRIAVFGAVAAVLVCILPRRAGWWAAFVLLVAFAVWTARKDASGTSGGLTSLRYPWRRWW